MSLAWIDESALCLFDARTAAQVVTDLPNAARLTDLQLAYAVQDRLHEQLVKSNWGLIAGHKIGCTTQVMQQYLGISTPCAGKLFNTTIFEQMGEYKRARLCKPGVECEIAVRLSKDIVIGETDQNNPLAARQHAASAVDAVMASIELVDARWQDFTVVPAPSLIADDFFGAGCVLGKPVSMDPETIDTLRGEMWVNDRSVGEGIGSDILGHPLDALVWLAKLRQGQGQPLRASEIVTLGSLVQTQWIDLGDEVRVSVEGLGTATLRLI